VKGALFLGTAALALCSALAMAQDAPESLLPPGFEDPTPAPTAAPAPRPSAGPTGQPTAASSPVVQPLPPGYDGPSAPPAQADLPSNLPTLEELEKLSTDELDELLGLKPKVDIPPAARRSMERVGVLAFDEGGLPPGSLANQPAALVRAALAGTKGPLVSRWGHILLRRARASRLAAPAAMDPAEFAALRIGLLNRMGEFAAARALAQDVDTANWSPSLTAAAIDAYIGTADIVGACPAVRLQGGVREDSTWRMLQGICNAYAGEGARARTDLNRIRSRGQAEPIDVLLAQRFAGAAGQGRSAVAVEWESVNGLTPWRFALANAVGEDVPERLLANSGPYYERVAAIAPMLALPARVAGADRAAREGIMSAAAIIDLYSQIHADEGIEGPAADTADLLREAYVGSDPAARLAAIRQIWGNGGDYARQVLTAYAAARMEPAKDFADDAAPLIAAMLSAGLERDALRWAEVVPEGSEAWALLVFAAPERSSAVYTGAVDSFIDDDDSPNHRKSRFLLAGLAGLDRIGDGAVSSFSSRLDIDLAATTRWTRTIDKAAAVDNKALVALLAGLGMQGSGWDRMTARHLYHIVSALNRVGLTAEARMIAAEAVARG
jgi:hypothetical protein